MRIAVYSRKSKFTGKGDSIENQVELAREYIRLHYPGISKRDIMVFEDEGYSGKNFDRPQFKAMMSEQSRQHFDAIVVYRLDRISRNVGDFASLIETLTRAGTAFVSIREQFDTATSMGRAMMNISATFAQLERETIAERIRDNMYQLARGSHWTGGTTPLGYKSEKETHSENGKTRSFYRLVIEPSEAAVVQIIFEHFLEKYSCKSVETHLINKGIRTRKGMFFDDVAIRRILTNPVYCEVTEESLGYFSKIGCEIICDNKWRESPVGFMSYNRTNQERKLQPTDKWLLTVGTHEPVICSSDWIRVQRILEENSIEYNKHARKLRRENNPISLLNGIIYCSCGAPMRTKRYRTGGDSFSYICTAKERSHKKLCEIKNCIGKKADFAVKNLIVKAEVDTNIISQHLRKLKESAGRVGGYKNNLSEALTRSINEKQKQIDNLTASISAGFLSGQALDHVNKTLNEALAELDELKEKQMKNNSDTGGEKIVLTDISSALSYLSANFDQIPLLKRREFIRKVIRKAVWDGENLDIYLVGSDDAADKTIIETSSEAEGKKTADGSPSVAEDDYANFKKSAPDIIRQYAAVHNLSLRKLAAYCGVSYTALKKWLNKAFCPSKNIYDNVFREYFLLTRQ